MQSDPTLAELLRLVIVLGALLVSGWALVDDVADLLNVRRYGEVGGPRWITAMEHLWFNATLLGGWLAFLGMVAIAIYLPSRDDVVENELVTIAGWLSLAFSVCVLLAQVFRRVERQRLRALPLVSWERMLASMLTGMSPADQAASRARLRAATAAGREMGHLIRNELGVPLAALSLLAERADLSGEERALIADGIASLEHLAERSGALHAEIRAMEAS